STGWTNCPDNGTTSGSASPTLFASDINLPRDLSVNYRADRIGGSSDRLGPIVPSPGLRDIERSSRSP
ncbi:MAG: hypothetical protein ACK5PD_05800, partial [Pirellulaceae bacterium]